MCQQVRRGAIHNDNTDAKEEEDDEDDEGEDEDEDEGEDEGGGEYMDEEEEEDEKATTLPRAPSLPHYLALRPWAKSPPSCMSPVGKVKRRGGKPSR